MDSSGLTRPLAVERTWAGRVGWITLAAGGGAFVVLGCGHAMPVLFVLGLIGASAGILGVVAGLVALPRWIAGALVVAVTAVGTVIPLNTAVGPDGLAAGRLRQLPAGTYDAAGDSSGLAILQRPGGWSLLIDDALVPLAEPTTRSQEVAVPQGALSAITTDQPVLQADDDPVAVVTAYGLDGEEAWQRRFPGTEGSVEVLAADEDGVVALSICKDDRCRVQAIAADGSDAWSTPVPDGVLLAWPRRLGDSQVRTLPGFVSGLDSFSRVSAPPEEGGFLFTIDSDGTPHQVEVSPNGNRVAAGYDVAAVLGQNFDGTCDLQAFDEAGQALSGVLELPCTDDAFLGIYAGTPDVYDRRYHHVLDLEDGKIRSRKDVGSNVEHHSYGTSFIEQRGDRLRFDVDEDGDARFEVPDVTTFSYARGTLAVVREPSSSNPFRNDGLQEVAIIDPGTGRTCARWRTAHEDLDLMPLAGCRAVVRVGSLSDGTAFLLGPTT